MKHQIEFDRDAVCASRFFYGEILTSEITYICPIDYQHYKGTVMATTKKTDHMIGNQWWKLRATHGRDKIFKTPDALLEAANEYFEFQSKKEWTGTDFRGKDAKRVQIPTCAPFTLASLCIFLGVNETYFNDFEDAIKKKAKKNRKDKDFSEVIAHIRAVIWSQKFEGAAVGAYAANLISMELGMKSRNETTVAFEQPLFGEIDDDEITPGNE